MNRKTQITKVLKGCNVPPEKLETLKPIIENVAFMADKLDEIRAQMVEADAVVFYDNGGGQTGYKENPIFKVYEALWKSYLNGMEKILACFPKPKAVEEEMPEPETPANVLSMIRARHTS